MSQQISHFSALGFLWMLGILLMPVSASAALCPDRPIKLAFFETPVLYIDGKGLDRDFVNELQRRSQCQFELAVMPRMRTWRELEEGHLDMATSVLPTAERKKTLWLINYYQLRNYLILSKAQAGHIKSLDEFLGGPKTLVFGQVRGYHHGAELDAWIGKLAAQGRVHEVVKTDHLYKMLNAERISAISGSPMIYKSMLQENTMNDKVVIVNWGGPSAVSPRGLGLSKLTFTESQAREWQKIIDEIRHDGTMRNIIGRYMSPKETRAMLLNAK